MAATGRPQMARDTVDEGLRRLSSLLVDGVKSTVQVGELSVSAGRLSSAFFLA
jgi:hypothetical protein